MNATLSRKKTVVVVEDDARLQDHLMMILDATDDITCLCAVSSAEEALVKIPKYQPDVVLMDIKLPGISGIDCIRTLKSQLPRMEVVMLTAYEEEDNIFRALKEGASGYLLKSSTPDEIYNAIRDVYSGGAPFSSHIARKWKINSSRKRCAKITRIRLYLQGGGGPVGPEFRNGADLRETNLPKNACSKQSRGNHQVSRIENCQHWNIL
jgi:DNA-binding NarL/FixJ family response regulator